MLAIMANMTGVSCLRILAFVSSLSGNVSPGYGRMKHHDLLADSSSTSESPDNVSKPGKKNLFKHQFDDYTHIGSSTVRELVLDFLLFSLLHSRDGERWQDIVMEEIAKNRNLEPSDNFLYGENNMEELNTSPISDYQMEVIKPSFNYRLSPEGRMKLEDRITHLKRMAASNPGQPKSVRPNLWIVRSSYGW